MKFMSKLLATALLSVVAAGASATVVDYSITIVGTYPASGQFTGVDANADGLINISELSAFTFDFPLAGYHFTLTELSDFGSYNVAQNLWLHDANGWNQSNFAYASFYNGSLSVNTTNASNVVTVPVSSQVPEPGSLALAALGLLAIGARRRSTK